MTNIKIKDVYIDKDSIKDCLVLTNFSILQIQFKDGTHQDFHFNSMNEADVVFNDLITAMSE